VDFETTETQIVCDDNGRIEKIVPRTRNDAHKLIEEAMLAANVCSADFIDQSGQLGLFRVHDKPSLEKQEILRNYLKAMGVSMSISENPSTKEFQQIANATKDRPDAQQIHTMLLRSMMQAFYTPINGALRLAFEAYTHFTSPIRRYPRLAGAPRDQGRAEGTHYKLPSLPTPGEAEAKLAKRLASRWCPGQSRASAGGRGPGLGGCRPALQCQRAPRRRGQPRCGGLAQVQVHARASGRGVRGVVSRSPPSASL
jgi:ribonuclease R